MLQLDEQPFVVFPTKVGKTTPYQSDKKKNKQNELAFIPADEREGWKEQDAGVRELKKEIRLLEAAWNSAKPKQSLSIAGSNRKFLFYEYDAERWEVTKRFGAGRRQRPVSAERGAVCGGSDYATDY